MAETMRIEEGLAQFPFPVEKALAERLAAMSSYCSDGTTHTT